MPAKTAPPPPPKKARGKKMGFAFMEKGREESEGLRVAI